MIPTFSGKIGRKAYWSGLLFWVGADALFTILIILVVSLLQPDKSRSDSPVNTLGALLFIMAFLYANLRVISLAFRRGRDLGKYGLLYACLTLVFTPMILIIGILPSVPSDQD